MKTPYEILSEDGVRNLCFSTILAKTKNLRLSTENTFQHVPSLSVRSLEKLLIDFDGA